MLVELRSGDIVLLQNSLKQSEYSEDKCNSCYGIVEFCLDANENLYSICLLSGKKTYLYVFDLEYVTNVQELSNNLNDSLQNALSNGYFDLFSKPSLEIASDLLQFDSFFEQFDSEFLCSFVEEWKSIHMPHGVIVLGSCQIKKYQ